jgi:hypothetical protein
MEVFFYFLHETVAAPQALPHQYIYGSFLGQIALTLARDVNEAKLPMSSLGLGSIRLGSCATQLLNELLVDMKIYSIIK